MVGFSIVYILIFLIVCFVPAFLPMLIGPASGTNSFGRKPERVAQRSSKIDEKMIRVFD